MTQRIDLLGAISITHDGKPRRIVNSPKGCALLAYLIVTAEQQRREQLADMLWDATSTSRGLQNLRELLVRVRRDVPEVETTRQTAIFVPTVETEVDLIALREGLQSADPATKDNALSRYKGELLSGFYVEGATAFNEWLLIERERLHRRVLDAYRQLCQHYQAHEMWAAGQTAARRWLQLAEWSDEACRYFMRFSAERNQFSAAHQMYETLRQRLHAELGVSPDQETTQLLARIERKRNAATWERLANAELLPPANLPPSSVMPFQRNRDFVGREETLKEIVGLFAKSAEQPQAVAITGIGGIGKTQTAVEFAYRYGQQFHGVYWLNFGDPENVASEIARLGSERGMGLFQAADQLSTGEQVLRVQRAWQEATPRLLIFDSCENEQVLADWLPVTGGCRVLLTSRRGIWSRGVAVVSQELLARAESVRLLQQLAPAQTAQEARQIAAKLGDLPLALHLAGSFLNHYATVTPANYLEQLNRRNLIEHPSLHGRGVQRSPTDHDLSLAHTFALSYDQLSVGTPAHHLLLALACCAAGEPVPQAVAVRIVTGSGGELRTESAELAAIDALTQLQALGLLTLQRGQITLHRLVVQFVRLHGELNESRQRIASILAELLQGTVSQSGIDLSALHSRCPHSGRITIGSVQRTSPSSALTLVGAISCGHRTATPLYAVCCACQKCAASQGRTRI